ncbi:FAD-binding, type 2 [Penicillium occitanis (nom. inval.)]|nr:FAD-binding, type 2 [Penicillium occitanis (nom. inval.)]PCG89936.1 hypothetical protein PENOC_104410 [Penicillium occitanis (nom. inval.)]
MFSRTTTIFALPFLSAMVSASQVNLNALFKPHLSSGARIILPSSQNYTTQAIQRWTVWEEPTYIGAIQPATEEDVEQIVKIAAKPPFLATGAGHGFGLGFGQVQNAIDIDLSQFKSVAIDAENNILTVGGSVTFSDIFQPLYDVGKEVPTGNIPCIGIMVGATLGAGVGPLQGLHGFIIDSLHSVRLTTASGDTVTVSKTENPDLFWAIRGAGANFGIITWANYTTYDSTNGGQVINADFLYAASANTSVFEALASFDEYIPSELGLSVEMSFNQTSKEAILVVNFIFFGNQTEAQPYLDRFNSIDYLFTDLQYVSWPELDGFSDFGPMALPALK